MTIVSHFLRELAYATGRNAHFMRFYGDQTQFLSDPANPHETSVYEKLRKYRDEIDRDIERRMLFVEKMRKVAGPSPLVAKLRSKG